MKDYYHGTSESSAVSLIRDGIQGGELQKWDRGFFGEGFYVTRSFLHAKYYGAAVVRVEFDPDSVRVFDASGLDTSSNVVTGPDLPSWYGAFTNWYVESGGDINDVNLSNPGVSRRSVANEVTEYARDEGYDIIEWNEHENIVLDYGAPTRIVPDNEQAEAAAREAGVLEPDV